VGLAEWIPAIAAYGIGAGFKFYIDKREFARAPEKAARYKALPLYYKVLCWFVVLPILSAGTLSPAEQGLRQASFVAGILGFIALEMACVRWYRKHGLL